MGDDFFVISDSDDEESASTSSWNGHRRSGGVRSREKTSKQSEIRENTERDVILLSSDGDTDSDSDLPDYFGRDNDEGNGKRKKRQKKSKKKVNVKHQTCHAAVKQEANVDEFDEPAFEPETNFDNDRGNSRLLRNGAITADFECDDQTDEPASDATEGNPEQRDVEGGAGDGEDNIMTLRDLDSETYSQVVPVEPYFSPLDLHSPVNHPTSPLLSASPVSPPVPRALLQRLPPKDLPSDVTQGECPGDSDSPSPSTASSASPASPSVPRVVLQPKDLLSNADRLSGVHSAGECSGGGAVNPDTPSTSGTGVHTSDDSILLDQALRCGERMRLKLRKYSGRPDFSGKYYIGRRPVVSDDDTVSDETWIEEDDQGPSNEVENGKSESSSSDETSEVYQNSVSSENDDVGRRPIVRHPVVSDDDTDSDETCLEDDDDRGMSLNEADNSTSEYSSSYEISKVYSNFGKSTRLTCDETEDDEETQPFSPSGVTELEDETSNAEGFDTQPFQPVPDDQIEYSSTIQRDTSSPGQNFATNHTELDSDGTGGSTDQEQEGSLDNSTGQYFPTDSQLSCSFDSEDTEGSTSQEQKRLPAEGTASCGKEVHSSLAIPSNVHLSGGDSECPEANAGKKSLPCLRNAWSPSELDPQQRFLMLQGEGSECISFSEDTPSNSVTPSTCTLSHVKAQSKSTVSAANTVSSGSRKHSPKKNMKEKERSLKLSRGDKLLSTLKENEKKKGKNETVNVQDKAYIPSTSNPSTRSPDESSETPSTSVQDISDTSFNQPSSGSRDPPDTPSAFGNRFLEDQSLLLHSNEVGFGETIQTESGSLSPLSTPSASSSIANGHITSTGIFKGPSSAPTGVLSNGDRSVHPSMSTPSASSTLTNVRTAYTGISKGPSSAPTGVLSNGVIRSVHPSLSTLSASSTVVNGRIASTGICNGPSPAPKGILSNGDRSVHPSLSIPSASSTLANVRTASTGISNGPSPAPACVPSNGVSRTVHSSGTSSQQYVTLETRLPLKKRRHEQSSSVSSGRHGTEPSTMTEKIGIKEVVSGILSWKYNWRSSLEGVPSADVLQAFLGCREVPRHQDAFQDVGSYQKSLICFLLLEMWAKVTSAVHRACDVLWKQTSIPNEISKDIVEVNYKPIDSSDQGLSNEDLVLVDMTAINAAENQYQFGLVRGMFDGTVTLALPYKNKVVPSSTRLEVVTPLNHYMNQIRALLSFHSNPLARHIIQPDDLSVFVKDGKVPEEGRVSDDDLLKSLRMSMSRFAQQQKLIRLMNGPPGTGKTRFLSRLIRRIIKEHRDIPKISQNPYKLLVCAPTSQSLDVLLRKIWEWMDLMDEVATLDGEALPNQKNIIKGVRIVRAGEAKSADERLTNFLLSTVLERKREQGITDGELDEELQTKILQRADIVGCTLQDCGSKIVRESLEGNVFALFVDDASHCSETELLLALQCKTKRVFLAGDREQEIIHILSKEAKQLGYGRSMLARIAQKFEMEGRSTCIHDWNTQYRMKAEIAEYPSSVMYLHRLKTEKKPESFFLRPYIIFDVSDGKESMQGESIVNKAEALFIKELIGSFSGNENKVKNIGIITESNGQKVLLEETLKGQKIPHLHVLIGTPINFFGLEKDVIILCCTSTGGTSNDHGFLMNKQVLNLVLTRAKFSLIIVGNMTRIIKKFTDWKYLVDDAAGRKLVFRTSRTCYREDAKNCKERSSQASTSRSQPESHTSRTEFRGRAAGHHLRVGQAGRSPSESVGRFSPGDQQRGGTSGHSPLTGSKDSVLSVYQQTWRGNGQCPTTESVASQGLQQRREQAGPPYRRDFTFESRHNPGREGNPAHGYSHDPMEELVLTPARLCSGHPAMDYGSQSSQALLDGGRNHMFVGKQVHGIREAITEDRPRAVEVPCHQEKENGRSRLRQDRDKGNREKRRVSFDIASEDHQRPAKILRTMDSVQDTSSQMNASRSSDYPQSSKGSLQPRGILKKPEEATAMTSHGGDTDVAGLRLRHNPSSQNGSSTHQDKPSHTYIPQRQRRNNSSHIPSHGSDNGMILHAIGVGLRNNERILRTKKVISFRGRTLGKQRPQRSSRKESDEHSRRQRRPSGGDTNAGSFSYGDSMGPPRRRENNRQRDRSDIRSDVQPQRLTGQEPPPERQVQRLESLNQLATNPVQLDPTMDHHRSVNEASGGRSTELTAPLVNVRRRRRSNSVKDRQMDYQD